MNEKKLKQIFAEVLEVDLSEITDKCSPKTIPDWDSLKQMSLILAIESSFGVQFDDDAVFELNDFDAISKALRSLLQS